MKKVLMKNALLVFAGILFFIASCKKEPTKIPVTSIAITSSSLNIFVGSTQQLTATISPTNATTQSVTWSSSDLTKATVDATGKVTGVAQGSAAITATATDGSNVKSTVTVLIVTVKATSIAITPANPSVGVGGNITLIAKVTPSDAAQTVTWVSSDPTKATVDAITGKVTGVGIGTTTIAAIAIDGTSIVGKTTLTVTSNAAILSAITLGDENFPVVVPASGGTAPLANAPRTFWATPKAVKVNLTVSDNAVIQIGSTVFTSGNTVDFTNSVTFKVTAQDGVTTNSYTVAITAYNATSNPYGVYTVKHLVDVNNGLDQSYLMIHNIDLPNADDAGATATGISDYANQGWYPLGYSDETPFTGTFNGGNFVINNFYTSRAATYVGLFGSVGRAGTIKNLGVNGKSGTGIASYDNDGIDDKASGILAGTNSGTIDHCFATGNISNSSKQPIAGGLVGGSNGTITNSYATVSVTAISNDADTDAPAKVYAGGLVGMQTDGGMVNNCYAWGNSSASTLSTSISTRVYGGGLIAYTMGAISNSYATGDVSVSSGYVAVSSSSGNRYGGGLVGYRLDPPSGNPGGVVVAGRANTTGATITNCYRNSTATIQKNGTTTTTPDDAATTGVTPKTKTEMQADTFTGNLNGSSGTTWGRTSGKNEGLPYIIGVGAGK